MSASRRLLLAAALAVGLYPGLSGCGSGESKVVRTPLEAMRSARTVVVVAIDGLNRDDAVGLITPTLTDLAAEGLTFENHVAASTGLNASLASLLTSLYPGEHGVGSVRERGLASLSEDRTTLAELARRQNWRTLASVGAAQLAGPMSGLDQGFEVWHAPQESETGGRAAQRVWWVLRPEFEAVLAGGEPVLGLLVFGDPGRPDSVEPGPATTAALRRRLTGLVDASGPLAAALDNLDDGPESLAQLTSAIARRRGSEQYNAWREALHEAQLAATDAALADVRATLAKHGRAENALIVVCGLRGALLAPPASSGGPTFRSAIQRTPLIFYSPGLERPELGDLLVSSVDVLPTLVEGLGWSLASPASGLDLTQVLRGMPLQRGAVLVEDALLERQAAFAPSLHVEVNSVRGDAAYDLAGEPIVNERRVTGETRVELDAARELLALSPVEHGLRITSATARERRIGVRWRLADGRTTTIQRTTNGEAESIRSAGLAGESALTGTAELQILTSRRELPIALEWLDPTGMLSERDLWVGTRPLLETLLPRLPSGLPGPWPLDGEGRDAPFLLDLVRDAGAWTRVVLGVEQGQEVEVFAMLHPPARIGEPPSKRPTLEWRGSQLEAERPGGRTDAIHVRGQTPFDLQLLEPPGRQLALVVRLAGEVIPIESIRRDGYRFAAPGSVRVYLPDWVPGITEVLDSRSHEPPPPGGLSFTRLGPVPSGRRALTPDEAELVERLGGGE